MKIDMHCHVKEGSPDSHVGIAEYIYRLRAQGFDGMLVTDHDSYGGYRYWKENLRESRKEMVDITQEEPVQKAPGETVDITREEPAREKSAADDGNGFTVLCGVEYDTLEAGHILVIMPSGEMPELFEHKGLRLETLIDLVHSRGGVLGPAHPCGEPFLSIFSTGKYRKDRSILDKFDFIEGFNCGEDPWCNEEACRLAEEYGLQATGGSDSHEPDCVGLAYTVLEEDVHTEDELISYIKERRPMECGGQKYHGTIKEHLGKWNKLLVYGFWPYNKFGALIHTSRRRRALKDYLCSGHHD